MSIIGKDIEKVVSLLIKGELVAIPTETVYGLAANGLDENAVLKIYQTKNRPAFNPLILHTNSIDKVREIVDTFPPNAELLAKTFWPGPLTLVLDKSASVPEITSAGLNTIAVRIPNHALTLELLSKLPFPLAAPSANASGSISPTMPGHVEKTLGTKIPYILDGGNCQIGIESTILKIDKEKVYLLRAGTISAEEIEEKCGIKVIKNNIDRSIQSPGMLRSHYAPQKKLLAFNREELEEFIKNSKNQEICILAFDTYIDSIPTPNQRLLSVKKDELEAARNLFNMLHELDEMDSELILAEFLPEKGIGIAINDKLRRASANK
ncbi:MAG: threonylcarbamoyl-AMP synthase [Chitinophagaceae bacterium]|nr:MAG: threonylcarbamoyl-AMP synthase [Chitinophagaceae bacterium]